MRNKRWCNGDIHREALRNHRADQENAKHVVPPNRGPEGCRNLTVKFKGKSPRKINTHGSALDDMLSAIVHKTGEKKYVPNDHQFGHMYKKDNFILVCLKPHASAVCFIFGMVVG